MHLRHPALVLLLWFPAVLLVSAPTARQHCLPPRLDNVGFVLTLEDKYNHNQTVSYSCDKKLKPAAKGWWAQITCLNGKWSPEPQCIDESSCVQPDVNPNTIYSPSPTGWYENGTKIQVRCDKGYGTKNNLFTSTCINGTWSSMPVCEKRTDSCSEPPQLPHAVIINQTHQEVFAVDSEVMYQCEDGYTTEQGESMKSVTCISGNWTEGPTCRSSSSSGSSVSTVPTVPISNCGTHPIVINAVVVQSDLMSLKYRCNTFYSLEGPEIVKCYSNGMWSEKPTCKVAYCVLNTEGHDRLKDVGRKYIKNGETVEMECQKLWFYWVTTHKAEVQCNDGEIQLGKCCSYADKVFTSCE